MKESIIIQKMISIGQHLEREEIFYSGAEADARALLEEIKEAINYTHCCETLKGKEVISFDLWCDIKNIHHSFDEYYLWDTTLIEYEIVLKMYESFVQNL